MNEWVLEEVEKEETAAVYWVSILWLMACWWHNQACYVSFSASFYEVLTVQAHSSE